MKIETCPQCGGEIIDMLRDLNPTIRAKVCIDYYWELEYIPFDDKEGQ